MGKRFFVDLIWTITETDKVNRQSTLGGFSKMNTKDSNFSEDQITEFVEKAK